MADYEVDQVNGRGTRVRTAYKGPDFLAAGAAEDRLLTAGKNTRVRKGGEVLSERTPQRRRGGR